MELTPKFYKVWEHGGLKEWDGPPAIQDGWTQKVVLASDYEALRTRLEAMERERDIFRAVLEGMEFREIDMMKTREIKVARIAGEHAAQMIKDLQQRLAQVEQERDRLTTQLATGHHPRCTTVGQVYVCHIECKLQLSNILSSQLGKAQARIRELVQCLEIAQRR